MNFRSTLSFPMLRPFKTALAWSYDICVLCTLVYHIDTYDLKYTCLLVASCKPVSLVCRVRAVFVLFCILRYRSPNKEVSARFYPTTRWIITGAQLDTILYDGGAARKYAKYVRVSVLYSGNCFVTYENILSFFLLGYCSNDYVVEFFVFVLVIIFLLIIFM